MIVEMDPGTKAAGALKEGDTIPVQNTAPDVNLEAIASQTAGMVGADLRNLANEAALAAARHDGAVVTQADFTEALEKVELGSERKLSLTPLDRERIAYHESGHALLGLLLPGADPVRRVSIMGITLAGAGMLTVIGAASVFAASPSPSPSASRRFSISPAEARERPSISATRDAIVCEPVTTGRYSPIGNARK